MYSYWRNPGSPTAQTLSIPDCPSVPFVQVANKTMYNQPNSFYASKAKPPQLPKAPSGRMAVLEDMLPLAGCNAIRIVMVQTVSAVWRFRPMSTFHSQGIRQLCGVYIITNFNLSSNTEIVRTLSDLVRNSSLTKRLALQLRQCFAHLSCLPLVAIVGVFLRLKDKRKSPSCRN